eukprot:COSAG02_NODE_14544_length_1261_cov_0.580895_2_plen_45_part_00
MPNRSKPIRHDVQLGVQLWDMDKREEMKREEEQKRENALESYLA